MTIPMRPQFPLVFSGFFMGFFIVAQNSLIYLSCFSGMSLVDLLICFWKLVLGTGKLNLHRMFHLVVRVFFLICNRPTPIHP